MLGMAVAAVANESDSCHSISQPRDRSRAREHALRLWSMLVAVDMRFRAGGHYCGNNADICVT
jgi:hypothetical protein